MVDDAGMGTRCPGCGRRFDTRVAPGLKDSCPHCLADFLMDATDLEEDPPEPAQNPAAAGLPVPVGAKIGGLEVIESLGRGGMGFVYKARQPELGRLVALKVLDPKLAASPEFALRFDREARALAALSHPNIVRVFEYGQDGSLCFLVMEYLEGASLRATLAGGKLPPEAALRYVPQICDALEYAHGRGVIHRDIKPENILIDRTGHLRIADFGLAKVVGPAGAAADEALTISGQTMGTPNYMAPEQAANMARADHRADIYSLGVVFYEMLTGALPLGRFPPPSQLAQLDARLDAVVLKALEKEPDKRHQRAGLVKEELARIAQPSGEKASGDREPGAPAPPARKPASSWIKRFWHSLWR